MFRVDSERDLVSALRKHRPMTSSFSETQQVKQVGAESDHGLKLKDMHKSMQEPYLTSDGSESMFVRVYRKGPSSFSCF